MHLAAVAGIRAVGGLAAVFCVGALVLGCCCRESRRLGTTETLPKRSKHLQVIRGPRGRNVTVVATVKGYQYPATTGGWCSGEIPSPCVGSPGHVDATLDVFATLPDAIPSIQGTDPKPEGFPIGNGIKRSSMDLAEKDIGRTSIDSCWSADGNRLAIRARVEGGSTVKMWSFIEFEPVVRWGVYSYFEGELDCAAALAQREYISWHPSALPAGK